MTGVTCPICVTSSGGRREEKTTLKYWCDPHTVRFEKFCAGMPQKWTAEMVLRSFMTTERQLWLRQKEG